MRAETSSSDDLHLAVHGVGPLLQRDYWAVIDGCRLEPVGVMDVVARRFVDIAPPELVEFRRSGAAGEPLRVGDDLDIRISLAGDCGVRVVHRDGQSLTLATRRGHPEAGRITFASYANARGDVLCHIRSRARASSMLRYAGFLLAGDPMQTNTWIDFVNRVAVSVGEGVVGAIQVTKRVVTEEPGDRAGDRPTFLARG